MWLFRLQSHIEKNRFYLSVAYKATLRKTQKYPTRFAWNPAGRPPAAPLRHPGGSMNNPAPPVWHPPGPIGFQGRHRGRVARFFVPEFMNSGVFLAPTGGTLLSFSGNGEFLPPAAFFRGRKRPDFSYPGS